MILENFPELRLIFLILANHQSRNQTIPLCYHIWQRKALNSHILELEPDDICHEEFPQWFSDSSIIKTAAEGQLTLSNNPHKPFQYFWQHKYIAVFFFFLSSVYFMNSCFIWSSYFANPPHQILCVQSSRLLLPYMSYCQILPSAQAERGD